MRRSRRTSPSAPIAVCPISPHIGILDSWLPVLWELKQRHSSLKSLALLPKDTVLQGVYPGDVIAGLAESLFDQVACRSKDGDLSFFGSFQDAVRAMQSGRGYTYHSAVPRDELAADAIALRDLGDSVRLICIDIKYALKPFSHEIVQAFPDAKIFSMAHGIDLHIFNSDRRSIGGEYIPPQVTENCVVYLQSPLEASFYREKFGLPERNLRIAGVVRHAARWVEMIKRLQHHEERPTGPYIFLASRRAEKRARFGSTQKRESLQDLGKLAQALNCKLVIRRHPREKVDTVYEEVLGTERYGTHWMYSSLHPFVLGSDALFCVTFRSAVAVDMAAIGTPTIELFDFEKLELGEDPTVDRRLFEDHDGELTSFYQRHGLVLGARNYAELKMRAEEILNDREGVVQRLTEAHRKLYTILPDPIAYVANDMESAVPSLARPQATSVSG